jgi:hypothetical protein
MPGPLEDFAGWHRSIPLLTLEPTTPMPSAQTGTPLTHLTGTEPDVLEPGIYDAHLSEIELRDTQYGERVRWVFTVDASDATLSTWTGLKTHASTKAGAIIEAMLGRRLAKGEALPIDELKAVPVQLFVKIDAESGSNRIEDVLRAKAKPQPRPVPAKDDEDDAAWQAHVTATGETSA